MKRIGVIICFVLIMLGVYSDAYADTDTATEETYNVTITWGDMSYIYNAISANWDTDNLIYNDITKGQWIERTSNSSGKIRIDNSSSSKINIDYANADTGYFTRKYFYKVSYMTIDSEENNVVFFENYNSLKTFVSGKTDIVTLKIEDYMSTNRETNIDASNMFKNCTSLEVLDLSELYTSNVVNMSNMFDGCGSLVTIYVSDKWNIDNVVNSVDMFNNCTSLVGAVAYDENNVKDKTYANWEEGYLTYMAL